MTDRLTETELAERLRVVPSTIQKWRRLKKGPAYIKHEGTKADVRYLITDVEAWENGRRVQPTE